MVQVLQATLESDNQDAAAKIFEVFDDMLLLVPL